MLTADMDLAFSALNASAVVGQKVSSNSHLHVSRGLVVRVGLPDTRPAST